jgi:signal transduction histidine kinase/DNA-binding response OmpR family regulator
MDILRDHGLDDESAPPSSVAWSGLIRALTSTEEGLSLADTHAGFDTVGSTLRDPLLLLDTIGGIHRWNNAAEPMIAGCEPGGQRSFRDFVRGPEGEVHADLMADFVDAMRENEEPMEGYIAGLQGFPDRGPYAYRIIPVGFDQVAGAVIRFVDRTEVRLSNERADLAHQEAGDVERTRAQFVTNTSHELRTPLNGILGMTSLLQDTKLNSEQREFVEIIQTSGENLLSLVNDILDFSKFEAGRFELEIIDYDLDRLVRDLADLLAPKAHDSGIELIVDLPPDLPTALLGDPGRIRQVLTNLASNAMKFTRKGEVVLSIRTVFSSGSQSMLRFEIQDTGVGIAPHAIERLFRPFQQADSSTTREYGGTGLGLAICKQIVDMMEGQIGVDSEVGVGSTFWFELPLHEQPVIRATRGETRPDYSTMSGKRVLIAESNTKQLAILKQHLESWGALVTCASDAEETDRIADEQAEAGTPFDVVLLDAIVAGNSEPMPPAKRIRRGHRVLMNTRLTRDEDLRDLVRPDASIRKPVRPRLLLDTIATLVDSPWLPGEGPDSRIIATTHPGTERMQVPVGPLVLLAEDNVVNQKVAIRVLSKMGYEVDVVGNGELAVQAVQERQYAAVLMDCQMPIMSGYEATQKIRAAELPDATRLPIIALTAHALPGDRQRCLEAGMDDYVTKPLRNEILAETLERWIFDEVSEFVTSASTESLSFSSAEILDDTALARLRSLEDPKSPGFVAEIINDFLNGLTEQVERLRSAAESRDVDGLRTAAHTFKGSSASVGAELLRLVSLKIEELSTNPDGDELRFAIEELENAAFDTRRVMEALPEMVSTSSPSRD